MIHVDEKPEPTDFDQKVRQKGLCWIDTYPDKGLKDYWRNCADDMYKLYDGFCAYLGIKLNRVQTVTIDHFLPKSKYPKLAYEWSNYRLCSPTVNSFKKDKEGVLDPFQIETGWFWFNFVDGSVYANESLSSEHQEMVNNTIRLLNLKDSRFCEERCRLWDSFKDQPDKLKDNAPFIYAEALRQNRLNVKSASHTSPGR